MTKKNDLKKGLGCLVLFALPFALVGLFMGYLLASSVWKWASMRSWEEVPAQIFAVDLESHQGDDSTTYQVTSQYRYQYRGVDYMGDRVSVHGGSDNVGSFHEDTYRELSKYRGQTFRCFVNPANPSESVLYRELRWELMGFYSIFVVVFGGAGFGLIAGAIYGARKAKREQVFAGDHPGEPWLHKEDWRTGRIRSSAVGTLIGSTVFAVLWNAITAPALFFAWDELHKKDNPAVWLVLIFPFAGVFLIIWAVRSFLRYRKFGVSVFRMNTLPGVIGGRLAGNVQVRVPMQPKDGFDVVLSSVRKVTTGSGKNRSTREHVMWQSSRTVRDARVGYNIGTSIPVEFDVPYDCLPSDVETSDSYVFWRLEVKADIPGVDYHAQFEVPVFRTAESDPDFEPRVADVPAEIRQEDLDRRLEKAGARIEHLPSGKRFVFPMARTPMSALGLTVFFVIWTGIVVVLFSIDAPRIFGWVFGFFDVLIFFGFLDMWFHASQVEVKPNELAFSGGLFGAGSTTRLLGGEIERVQPKRGLQSGDKLYYQLELRERGGKAHVLAKRLPDLETAKRIAQELDRILRG